MTNKAGRTVRKQIPEPVIPEEPPLDVRCLCPKCSNLFSPEEIGGAYLNRLCPSCGTALSETAYDERARANRSMGSRRSFLQRRQKRKNGRSGVMASCMPGSPF